MVSVENSGRYLHLMDPLYCFPNKFTYSTDENRSLPRNPAHKRYRLRALMLTEDLALCMGPNVSATHYVRKWVNLFGIEYTIAALPR